MACQVWWYGRLHGDTIKRTGRRKPSIKKNVRRGTVTSRRPQGGYGKKVVKPSSRREMAFSAVMLSKAQTSHLSICVACVAFSISETCYRYKPKFSLENEDIADWLIRLTHNQRNWGFGLCFLYLRNVKHFGWKHKRVYRIYRELSLNQRIKPRKRLVRTKPQALAVPAQMNEVWLMDLCMTSYRMIVLSGSLT